MQTRQQQQQGVNFIGPSGTLVYTNSSSFAAPNCVERETETTDRRTDIDRELYSSQAHVWWDAVTRGGCEYIRVLVNRSREELKPEGFVCCGHGWSSGI